jgi:phage tail-like protein
MRVARSPFAEQELFANTRYRVEIEGLQSTGALEVLLPEARLIAPGANKRVVQYGPLVLKRALARSDDWYAWWDRACSAPKKSTRTVTVVLLDRAGSDAIRWVLSGAQPTAYSISSLSALGDQVLLETLELAVAGYRASFLAGQSAGGAIKTH